MKRVQLARLAQADIRALHAWIVKDNPSAAAAYLEGLYGAFRYLTEWPLTGRMGEQYRPGLRIHVYRQHLVYYRSDPSGIVVVRVVHGRRDQGRVFQ